MTYRCYHCQHPWVSSLRQPAVKETCAHCNAYLHSCRNCRFHRKGYPNECYIPDTEKVADKTRANFCDEFEFRDADRKASTAAGSRAALDRLLGETPSENEAPAGGRAAVQDWLSTSEPVERDFDDLFDD